MNDLQKSLARKPLLIEHDITISTYEIDFAGHVSNTEYLRWLEDMRLKMFDVYFPLQRFLEEGITPVIASTYIEYKKPCKLFDKPHGIMWMADVARASMTIEAEIYVDEALCTKAKHVGVFVDLKTMKPVRVPSRVADAFKMAVVV